MKGEKIMKKLWLIRDNFEANHAFIFAETEEEAFEILEAEAESCGTDIEDFSDRNIVEFTEDFCDGVFLVTQEV